jgi:fucose 4-O-acetylase-like acetyltransferase
MENCQIKKDRIGWLDTARALGMLLVFNGHLIQRYIQKGIGSFDLQMTLIYSFHMPFFFFVSGVFFSDRKNASVVVALGRLFVSRMLPVVLFNIMGFVSLVVVSWMTNEAPNQSLMKIDNLLRGNPAFNYVTWFLICLFWVEVISLLQHRFFGDYSIHISIPFFVIIMYLTSHYSGRSGAIPNRMGNAWFILSAFAALVFYQSGTLFIRSFYQRITDMKKSRILPYLITFTVLWLLTAIMNIPFLRREPNGIQVVLINTLNLGNILFFLVSAFSGSIVLLLISSLLPKYQNVTFIGANSLILLGLQGIIHSYVNPYFLIFNLTSNFILFSLSWFLSVLTLVLCYPLIKPLSSFFRNVNRKYDIWTGTVAREQH